MTGCASPAPDIVATQQSRQHDASATDGSALHLEPVRECRDGKYSGIFSSKPGADGAPSSALRGLLSFALVKEPSGEFHKVTTGDKLVGSSESGDSFSADIDADRSIGCKEGYFAVELINGIFVPANTTNQYPFTGSVTGNYLSADGQEAFVGSWKSFFLGSLNAEGAWTAVWFGPQ